MGVSSGDIHNIMDNILLLKQSQKSLNIQHSFDLTTEPPAVLSSTSTATPQTDVFPPSPVINALNRSSSQSAAYSPRITIHTPPLSAGPSPERSSFGETSTYPRSNSYNNNNNSNTFFDITPSSSSPHRSASLDNSTPETSYNDFLIQQQQQQQQQQQLQQQQQQYPSPPMMVRHHNNGGQGRMYYSDQPQFRQMYMQHPSWHRQPHPHMYYHHHPYETQQHHPFHQHHQHHRLPPPPPPQFHMSDQQQYMSSQQQSPQSNKSLSETNPLQSLERLVLLPESQVIDPKSVVNEIHDPPSPFSESLSPYSSLSPNPKRATTTPPTATTNLLTNEKTITDQHPKTKRSTHVSSGHDDRDNQSKKSRIVDSLSVDQVNSHTHPVVTSLLTRGINQQQQQQQQQHTLPSIKSLQQKNFQQSPYGQQQQQQQMMYQQQQQFDQPRPYDFVDGSNDYLEKNCFSSDSEYIEQDYTQLFTKLRSTINDYLSRNRSSSMTAVIPSQLDGLSDTSTISWSRTLRTRHVESDTSSKTGNTNHNHHSPLMSPSNNSGTTDPKPKLITSLSVPPIVRSDANDDIDSSTTRIRPKRNSFSVTDESHLNSTNNNNLSSNTNNHHAPKRRYSSTTTKNNGISTTSAIEEKKVAFTTTVLNKPSIIVTPENDNYVSLSSTSPSSTNEEKSVTHISDNKSRPITTAEMIYEDISPEMSCSEFPPSDQVMEEIPVINHNKTTTSDDLVLPLVDTTASTKPVREAKKRSLIYNGNTLQALTTMVSAGLISANEDDEDFEYVPPSRSRLETQSSGTSSTEPVNHDEDDDSSSEDDEESSDENEGENDDEDEVGEVTGELQYEEQIEPTDESEINWNVRNRPSRQTHSIRFDAIPKQDEQTFFVTLEAKAPQLALYLNDESDEEIEWRPDETNKQNTNDNILSINEQDEEKKDVAKKPTKSKRRRLSPENEVENEATEILKKFRHVEKKKSTTKISTKNRADELFVVNSTTKRCIISGVNIDKTPTTKLSLTTSNTGTFHFQRQPKLNPVEDTKSQWKCILCWKNSFEDYLGPLYGPYKLDDQCKAFLSDSKGLAKHYRSLVEVWFHRDCAIWNNHLHMHHHTGDLVNVSEAVITYLPISCSTCHLPGAALTCRQRHCKARYHYSCARATENCQLIEENYSVYCPKHQ
ncbi:unnamed protein product, partial [Didymodactylos carnosus]